MEDEEAAIEVSTVMPKQPKLIDLQPEVGSQLSSLNFCRFSVHDCSLESKPPKRLTSILLVIALQVAFIHRVQQAQISRGHATPQDSDSDLERELGDTIPERRVPRLY